MSSGGGGTHRTSPVVPCPVLIGRTRETDLLVAALDAAIGGRGQFVFITGEAGIGKSRLVQEVTALAADRGVRVLRGRAVPGSAGAAYRPLAEALLPLVDELGQEEGGWRGVLATILSASPSPAAVDLPAPVAGEAVIRALADAGRSSSGVLVIEDLHWADPETVAIVEHLSDSLHRVPTLAVVTVRADEATAAGDLVKRVAARRSATVLELERLNEAQVAAMVHRCQGDADLDRAATLGEGIPFLIEELLLSPGLPRSIAGTVQARLNALTDTDRRVLGAAAAFGRHFDWRLLPAATGLPVDDVVAALERSLDAQLLVVDGEGFCFRHALTADAVFSSFSPPRRKALAGAVLAAIDARSSPDLAPPPTETVARLAESADQPDRAGRLHLALGEAALQRSALRTAVASLERAVDLLSDGETRARARERLVDALAQTGRIDDALATGAELLAELTPDREAVVRLRLAEAATTAARPELAAEHLAAAARLLDGEVPPERQAELAMREAELALAQSEIPQAERRAEHALSLARSQSIVDVECAALQLLGRAARRTSLDDAEARFRQALAVAERHELPMWRQRALYEIGTIALLDRSDVEALLAAQRQAEALGAMATATVLDIEIAAGYAGQHQLEAQARHARSAIDRGEQLGLGYVVAFAWSLAASAALLSGDREGGDTAAAACRQAAPGNRDLEGLLVGGYDLIRALLEEDRAAARDRAAECTRLLRGSDTAPPMHLRGAWPLLLAIDHDPEASAVADELERAGLAVARAGRGALQMARAIVAGWTDPTTASAQAQEADALLASTPFWRHVVRRLTAEAAMGDGWPLPEAWLSESGAWLRGQGYHRLAAACRDLSGAAPDGIPTAWSAFGITHREADVLFHLVEGRANKEIARALSLSVRTVEKHVESLLRKTGTSTRTELARVAGPHS